MALLLGGVADTALLYIHCGNCDLMLFAANELLYCFTLQDFNNIIFLEGDVLSNVLLARCHILEHFVRSLKPD